MTYAVHFDNMRWRKKLFCSNGRPTSRYANIAGTVKESYAVLLAQRPPLQATNYPSIAPAPTTEVIVPRHSTVSRLSGPSATIQAPTFDVMLTDTMSYFALIVPEKLPRIRGIKLGFSEPRSRAVQSNTNAFTREKGGNVASYPIRWDELRTWEICKSVHRS